MKLKHGIASPSTITRMLCGIDEELALYAFMEWIGEIADSKNTHLAIDGKALRGATEKTKGGTTPMLLNVVDTVRGLIFAQLPVDSKTNEIGVIPELLKLLDIKGSVITMDAIGTQTAIMEQIHEQEGHFVLTVKKTSRRLMKRSIGSWINWKRKKQKRKPMKFRMLLYGSILKNMKKPTGWKKPGQKRV